MQYCTGCVSIGTQAHSTISIERVIEFCDPRPDVRTIWVDIYLNNPAGDVDPVYILHRGNLSAENVTKESWSPCAPPSRERSLSDLIQRLHAARNSGNSPSTLKASTCTLDASSDSIARREGGVQLGDDLYGLWSAANPLFRVAGTDQNEDVPYTMWRIQDLHEYPRTLLRLKAILAPATYLKQIGVTGSFEAYGEALLLDRIECDDLPYYSGNDAEHYRKMLRAFNHGIHLVPRVFEYLVVAPGWRAQRLSWASQPFIPNKDDRQKALWFVADIEKTASFSLDGRPCNSFKLGVYQKDLVLNV